MTWRVFLVPIIRSIRRVMTIWDGAAARNINNWGIRKNDLIEKWSKEGRQAQPNAKPTINSWIFFSHLFCLSSHRRSKMKKEKMFWIELINFSQTIVLLMLLRLSRAHIKILSLMQRQKVVDDGGNCWASHVSSLQLSSAKSEISI